MQCFEICPELTKFKNIESVRSFEIQVAKLTCEEMPEHKYKENDLYDTGDAAKWAKIIQLFQTNEKLRWDQESHS